MRHFEVKSKKTGKLSVLNEEEVEKLKKLKIDDRFKIEEIKPMRQIISPFKTEKSEEITVVKKETKTKIKDK